MRVIENRKVKRGNSLAALVVEWGQKHCAAPATFAAEFVNAGMPENQARDIVCQVTSCFNSTAFRESSNGVIK